MSIVTIVLLIFTASQFYWAWRAYHLAARTFPARDRRLAVCGAVLVVYLFVLAFNFGWFGSRGTAVHLTLTDALLAAPFLCWLVCSIIGFLLAILFAIPQGLVAAGRKLAAKPELASPPRRQFLERTATVATAAPFVAGAYGLLYGRLNLETTTQRIRLPKLPREFEGFRICQLSDIHIGPFMPAEEIRKYAAIANSLKPDLTVLTGDFVTFDPTTQQAVVEALSGLRAPYGVYGCLGNHDAWARVEDSITELFQQTGVRILRGENVPIVSHGESLNLIGVDFQSHRRFGPSPAVAHILRNIEDFVARDRVNILLSHNPDTFDRAAELGVDLSMAGHTHGGQAALEFISPEIAPSRLVTPYVAGLFQKPGGQLYVNRGIGTIFIPIRIGAPPEITVYQLFRG
ncbi:putative Metallophosphoesterase [Candidatus Sulfopaludibacter sp. SbA3]|nr:putative Metallophosphoesterase [Candidatus Sulfopaludibacter sp. SbA3]